MLQFDQIMIRTIEERDLEILFAWNSEKFRGAYQETLFVSRQQLLRQYEKDGFCSEQFQTLLVEVNGCAAGLVYLTFVRAGLVKLGMVLTEAERGGGLGEKITIEICDYLFKNYDSRRIEADTDIQNLPAQRVLEKAGFTKEGVLRSYRYHHGNYHDSVLYSKLHLL